MTRNIYVPKDAEKPLKELEKILRLRHESLSHFLVACIIAEVEVLDMAASQEYRENQTTGASQ